MKTRIESNYDGSKSVVVYTTEENDQIGRFAQAIIERWALVAAVPDGEDSAGRAKARLPSPEELVTRAFNIAESFFAESHRRGHLIDLPDLNEINKENDQRLQLKEETRRA